MLFRGMIGNSIRLDACSICNLKCPLCSTGKGQNKKTVIGSGYLTSGNFQKFIQNNKWIRNIELSNWGEIFLNPELKNIFEIACKNNISLSAGNGVNLNNLSDKMAESLVKYNVKHISVSIDGATQETYSQYRKGGNINNIFENIKKINSFKKKYNSQFPKLTWQFVLFGHNEDEISMAKEKAEELKMKFKVKLNWDFSFSPVKNIQNAKQNANLIAVNRKEFYKITGKEYKEPCLQLWHTPQINWDGKLLGCCVNRFGDFGNVFKNGFIPLLKSKKYIQAKGILAGKSVSGNDIPCYMCERFLSFK